MSYVPIYGIVFMLIIMLSSPSNSSDLKVPENPLPECPGSPNCIRTHQSFSVDSSTVLSTADLVLTNMGAESVEQDPESGHIHAVFRIPIFGWKDDVNITVHQNESITTLYIRSASRVGYSDLGVNNRRVKKFFRLFNKQLSN